MSLSKNPDFCTAHSSRRNGRDTKQPLNKHMIQLDYFIDYIEYDVHVIFIPLDI